MLRIFSGIMLVAVMALTQPAMAARWSSAPKFCSPTSAVRWNTEAEREPCHCPPQSSCPKTINVSYGDITFYVTQDHDSYTISGSAVPALSNGSVAPVSVLSMGGDALINLLGINRNVDRYGNVTWNTHITAVMQPKSGEETLKMPLPIVNQCCDNPCPASNTLQVKDLTVTKPYPEDFGLFLDATKVNKIKKDLEEFEKRLDKVADKELIALSQDIRPALDDFFDKRADTNLLNPLIEKTESFNDLADKLTLSFRQDNKTVLDEITALNLSARQERDKRTKPPETVTISSLTCAAPPATKDVDVIREGCIFSGTPITLADGTTKPIEALKVGDQLQSHNGTATILAKSKFSQREDTMYSINKGEAFFTVEHPILTTQGWKSVDATVTSVTGDTIIVGSLAVGDVLLLAGGKELTVTSIDKKPLTNGVDAYNLSLTGDGSFVAQGFIMKGFKKMQMHY